MEKSMIEKSRDEGTIVWFWSVWSDIPIRARVTEIQEADGVGYAHVECVCENEYDMVGSQDVLFQDLYPSKEGLLAAMSEKDQEYIEEIQAKIQTMEDCIVYLYDHHVACGTEYTDWTARKAIQELAMERWGLELG